MREWMLVDIRTFAATPAESGRCREIRSLEFQVPLAEKMQISDP